MIHKTPYERPRSEIFRLTAPVVLNQYSNQQFGNPNDPYVIDTPGGWMNEDDDE